MSDPIESAILEKLHPLAEGKSICPSDVAKQLQPEQWQRMMPRVRATALGMMRQGRLVITKKGRPVDPSAFKGVIRLRLPLTGEVLAGVPDADAMDTGAADDGSTA